MRVRVLLAACSLAIALAACPVEGARAAETAGDETGSAAVATAPSGENSVGEGLTLEGDEPEGVDAAGPADKQEQAVVADAEEPVRQEDNLPVLMERNKITYLQYLYDNGAGEAEVRVWLDDHWEVLHNLSIEK